MRATAIFLILLAPLTTLALATPNPVPNDVLVARQTRKAPPPCKRAAPEPTEPETKARHDKFVNAFLVKKNITEAFEYIVEDYINHNPMAQNGSASAWNILSPIWGSQNIQVLRTTFKGNMGWLNYRSGFGEIVDRFRWEGGCIAEHWDQGEKYPTNVTA